MAKTCRVTTCNAIQERLKTDYGHLRSWRAVGRLWGLSSGLAYRMAIQGYEPKNPELRRKLGLPVYRLAPACPDCGIVHVSDRCPKNRKAPASLFDMPVKVLRLQLEHREELIR